MNAIPSLSPSESEIVTISAALQIIFAFEKTDEDQADALQTVQKCSGVDNNTLLSEINPAVFAVVDQVKNEEFLARFIQNLRHKPLESDTIIGQTEKFPELKEVTVKQFLGNSDLLKQYGIVSAPGANRGKSGLDYKNFADLERMVRALVGKSLLEPTTLKLQKSHEKSITQKQEQQAQKFAKYVLKKRQNKITLEAFSEHWKQFTKNPSTIIPKTGWGGGEKIVPPMLKYAPMNRTLVLRVCAEASLTVTIPRKPANTLTSFAKSLAADCKDPENKERDIDVIEMTWVLNNIGKPLDRDALITACKKAGLKLYTTSAKDGRKVKNWM